MVEQKEKNEVSVLNITLNKYKSIFAIVTVVIIVLVGAILVWWPAWQTINHDNQNRVPQLRADRDSKANYLQQLKRLDQRLQTLQRSGDDSIAVLDEILPSQASAQLLFVAIENMVQQAGFAMQKITVTESKTDINDLAEFQTQDFMSLPALPDQVKALDVNIIVEGGGYNQFKNLLARIERDSRLFNIITVNFAALSDRGYVNEQGDEVASKQYSFNLRTYYLSDNNAEAKGTK